MIHCRILLILTLIIVTQPTVSSQGSVLFVGGGSEDHGDWSDVPYGWLVQRAPNKKVLVMHYSTNSSFMPGYFTSLGALSSTNLVISSAAMANDSANYRTILEYDGIFLRGGDQWQYISKWKGTLVEQAIKEVFQRGGVVGGTSAGEAVLSGVIFDARTASVSPRTALQNPLGAGITLTTDFLGFVPGVLADNHFYERGRIARLMAMLAFHKTQSGTEAAGIGVDANTAFGIAPDGVGTAMGSGTVTVLRFAPSTVYTLQTSAPFSLRNMRLDQLTAGFTYDTKTGSITAPPAAFPYTPIPFAQHSPRIMMDGGGRISEWASASGGLKRLQSLLSGSSGPVGIIGSSSTPSASASVDSCLAVWNVPRLLLPADESSRTSQSYADAVNGCSAYIFAGLNPDSAARLFDASLPAGQALRSALAAGRPALFLANDLLAAGDTGVAKIESHIYAAYYGYMTLVKGLGIVNGMTVVPRLFENSDYTDNRASALFWGMANGRSSYGVMLDAGSSADIRGGNLYAFGATPAVVVDARNAHTAAYPSWIDPGKSKPRQNAALIGAFIHAVRPGDSLSLLSVSGVRQRDEGRSAVPERFRLHQNVPNPFNPSTTIGYQLSVTTPVRLRVFDSLGREVAELVNGVQREGRYDVRFSAPHLSSGPYVYMLTAAGAVQSRVMHLVK